jgi:acetoacetate decarboxylase
MPFPSPPWDLRGQAWLSVFWVAPPGRTPATHVVGFVSYEAGGALSYSELLVARRHGGLRRLTIDQIWVDSRASLEGGRALWGIPKEPAEFHHDTSGLGPVRRARWAASAEDRAVASADFADASQLSPRVPFAASLEQPRSGGSATVTGFHGSARSLPCLGHWEFAADGPLSWLAGKQPVASFRVRDFALTFG